MIPSSIRAAETIRTSLRMSQAINPERVLPSRYLRRRNQLCSFLNIVALHAERALAIPCVAERFTVLAIGAVSEPAPPEGSHTRNTDRRHSRAHPVRPGLHIRGRPTAVASRRETPSGLRRTWARRRT